MANTVLPQDTTGRDALTADRPGSPLVIAITGIHGTLGRRALARLVRVARIAKIVCVDTTPPTFRDDKVTFHDVDLTSLDAQRQLARVLAEHRVDGVAHLAFRDGPSPYPGRSHELESIGTMRLVQACLEAKVRKILMWSRTWVYGAAPDLPALLDEGQPTRARRSERFFADKIDAERDVAAFRAPGRGRHATILRMAPLVDPTTRGHVLSLLGDARVPSILGFDPMLQLLHIDDACRALEHLMLVDGPSVVNVASTGVVPLSVARRALNARPLVLPRSLASAAVGGLWLTGAGRIPPSFLDYLQFPCVADCSLLRNRFKFRPRHDTMAILEQATISTASTNLERSPA